MEDGSSSPQPGGDDNNTEMSENDTSSIVPDVVPLEDYNIKKSKLKASLKWMVAKAYTQYEPPPDLKEPFFQDAEGEEHLKPSVIYQLASSELYSMASTNVFPPTLHQWQGHWSIIQGLSRKGVYVVDDKEQPVTETVLAQTQRIKLSAHLAMMDAIQRAYVAEVASIEKVVQSVRQFSTFSASSELPFDVEDGLLFWMNKVCTAVRHKMEKERKTQQSNLMQGSPQKVRIRREQLQAKELPSIPVMDDLMKDLGDGCSLAVLLHFYFPHLMSLDDLSLQDPMSFAESIHNLGILEDFFQQHLPQMYPFKPEDLLYSPACLKSNVLAMLGELFYTCEVTKPHHLKQVQEQENKSVVTKTPDTKTPDSISSKLPPLPISSATKKSFQTESASNLERNNEAKITASNPELNKIGTSTQLGQQPLLPKRHRQLQGSLLDFEDDSLQSQLRRATSLDNIELGKRSFIAWQKPEERLDVAQSPIKSSEPIKASVGSSQASSLLTNVSLDSELGQSMTLDELGESQNTPLQSHREVEPRPGTYAMPNYADEDDLEVESLTSALSRVSRASENAQPQSLDVAPAVAGGSIDSRQSQYNGTKEGGEPRQEAMRLDSIDQPSESASYVGESHSSLGYTLGGTSGSGHEQVEHPNNFHRKKLTLDIQPVPIGQSRGRHHQEKLMPAVVRPLKEKSQSANKQEERGVLSQSRSPRQTSWGGSGKQEDNILSPELEPTTPLSPKSIADSLASDFSQSQRNKDSVSQHQQQQQQSQPPKGQFSRVPFQPLNQNISQEPQMTSKNKHGEAFYIHANPDQNMQYQDNVMHESVEATRPHPTSSFTIVDKQYTVESAQQAGIPVVGTSMDGQRSWSSHPPMESGGGGGSPRIMQSNSFSHPTYPNHMHSPHHYIVQSYHSLSHSHNSSPIHNSSPMHTPPPLHTPPPGNPHYPNPHYPNPHHSPQHSSPRRSPMHHYPMQHTSPQSPHHGHLPHNPQYTGHGGGSTSLSGGRVELTRFGNPGHGAPSHHHNNQEPLAVGLAQVRLRLEEKRRNMEKEKRMLERHSLKQRQRVGKAAFLQVLATQKQAKETRNVVEEGTLGRRPYSREEIERSLDEAQNRWLQEPSNQGKTTFAALTAHKEKSSGSIDSRDSDSPRGGRSDSPSSVVDMRSKGSPSSSESHSPPPQLTPEQYNVSLDKMNENMSQLMREIQKISMQQEQLKTAMQSPRSEKESPRQATKPSTGRQLSSSSSGSDAPGFMLHGGGGGGTQTGPDNQPFFLGATTPSPPGPPPVESDNEPFVLQENPLFSMSEQMSPPSGRPAGGQPGQSPQGSPREGHNTYVVQKRKARPKLDMTATESLASKRGQQIAPVETNVTTDAPVTSDNQDKSPEGFRLHSGDSEPETAEVVQVNDYKAPVGFEIVDDVPKSTPKKRPPQQKQPEQRVPRRRTNSSGSPTRSPTKKRPPSVYEIVGETDGQEEVEQMVVKPLDESQHEIDDSGDSKVLGFVVAQDTNEEDEIAKKREQFLRSRLKKQEAEKAKKAAREAQAEKLKEEHRRKQDEIEAKKAKEIERREKIRLAYQKRKQKEQDEQDGGPPPMREKKSSRTKSRPRSRIIDENTDFAKPTISSGPPAVSAQDVAEANMPISKQKTSFTISSSNGQSERNGGGATERMNSGHTTPTQSIKSSPSAATTPTTAPAGVPSGAVKATSPKKPPSVPDAVRRRPPSPRVRPKQNGTKLPSPLKAGPSPTASGPPSEAMGSVRSDETQSTTAQSVVSQNSDDSGGSGPPEYTGPKLYVKPASKSNRHIITNAIAHCVLAGAVNQGNKDKVLQEVAKSDYKHYVLLFRNTGLQFRGLYGYSPDSDEISKIYGTGPRHITGKMIEGLYKYSSGNKSFSKIPSKTMSVQIDGITIANHLWQSKKPSTKKH